MAELHEVWLLARRLADLGCLEWLPLLLLGTLWACQLVWRQRPMRMQAPRGLLLLCLPLRCPACLLAQPWVMQPARLWAPTAQLQLAGAPHLQLSQLALGTGCAVLVGPVQQGPALQQLAYSSKRWPRVGAPLLVYAGRQAACLQQRRAHPLQVW